MARVGFLGTGGPSGPGRQLDNVKQGMTDLGYVEGQQYTVEARYAENNLERLPGRLHEVVSSSDEGLA
jgi:hypothetical protein